ncbi:MAG: hypothetical protein RBS07_16960 [Lentimicrobium sp.]|jgi:hypothetical protein|nr:hypothetical protein [Lentimicrobium sp.]
MEKKYNFRFDSNLMAELSRLYGTQTYGAARVADLYLAIRRVTLESLKGKFRRNEMLAIVDCFNGINMKDSRLMTNKAVFIATLEDSNKYNSLYEKHNIDPDTFTQKVEDMTIAEVVVLVDELWRLRNVKNSYYSNIEVFLMEIGSM